MEDRHYYPRTIIFKMLINRVSQKNCAAIHSFITSTKCGTSFVANFLENTTVKEFRK